MAEDDSILPTKGLFFDETLQQLYESSIDQLLKDLGYNITLYLEPVSQDCPNCFESGTLVKMQDGYKEIEKITLGDIVIDNLGQYQLVDKLYKRKYKGEFTSINADGYTNIFSSTSNHKIFIERNGDFIKVPAGEVKAGDNLILPVTKYKREDLKSIIINWSNYTKKGVTKSQVEAVKELILHGHSEDEITDATGLSKHLIKKATNSNHKPRVNFEDEIEVDDDILFLLGWFIAEGCVHIGSGYPRQFSYCLNSEKEEWVADELIKIFKNKFNIIGKKEFRKNAKNLVVNFYSSEFAKLLLEQCGHTSENKKIPDFLYDNLGLNQLSRLVEYIVDGDGHIKQYKKRKTVYLDTVSKILANQVFSIWQANKKLPHIAKTNSTVDRLGVSRKEAYRISYSTSPRLDMIGRRLRCHYEIRPVVSTSKDIRDTVVYNIRVTNTHNYIANGVSVANCGVGPNGKSDGRYNSSNTNTLNGPLNRFFPTGAICPVCAGQGKLLTENTKDWTALIKYSPEEWDNEETGIDKTEVVRLKTRIEALSHINNSVKAKIEGNFYKLEGDPVKKGLQVRTYLSSFWKRIE